MPLLVGLALHGLCIKFGWLRWLARPMDGGLTLPGERWLFDPSAFWAGIGDRAMLGELPNSMLKRQLRIPPGTAGSGLLNAVFYVIDQIDMLVGVWVVMYFFIDLTMVRVFRYIIFRNRSAPLPRMPLWPPGNWLKPTIIHPRALV